MKTDFVLTDFLKLVRTLKNQIEIIDDLTLSEDEKKIADKALDILSEELEKKI